MILRMKTKLKKIFLWFFLWMGILSSSFCLNTVSASNFNDAMEGATETIKPHLDSQISQWSAQNKAEEIVLRIVDVFFSVMIVVWVLVAMIGFYQILTSSDESKVKTGVLTLIYGVIWIILMFSAKYLTNVIFWIYTDTSWSIKTSISPIDVVSKLYSDMVYPFLKIAIYLCLWILVLLMMFRVFTYITSQDEWTKKKSMWVIVWTTIGMLLITWAKQIVEAVYWKQDLVLQGWGNLSKIGDKIFNPADIPIIYNVINWALWLTAFVLLVMIIIQTYKLLTKPDDAATFTSLKKTIIYALGWVLLIWAAYLLSNLFIIW